MSRLRTSVWSRWQPSPSSPWDVRRVVHLHRRASFAATWAEVQRDLADGPQRSIDRLLAGEATHRQAPSDFESMSQIIGDAAVTSENINRLKAWWVYRMLFSPDPLGERLTLMWHNHFATSNFKVRHVASMRRQNEILREHSRGPFADLLKNVIRDPAMLVWLDGDANRKGNPNENLARELMELFTVGVGNYIERDVKESARALTGWTVDGDAFTNDQTKHDSGEKTILGQSDRFDGDGLLDILLRHEATSRRIAFRICEFLLGENVAGSEAIDELASELRSSRLDIGSCVETVLRSELFFQSDNIGSRVLAPIEFIAGAIRSLEMTSPPPSTLLIAEWASRLGQNLFHPPNVFGWPGGRSWLTSRALIGRANFADSLVSGHVHHPAAPLDEKAFANRYGIDQDANEMFGFLLSGRPASFPSSVRAILHSPAAQLS